MIPNNDTTKHTTRSAPLRFGPPRAFQRMTEEEISERISEDKELLEELSRLVDDFAGQCSRLQHDGKDPRVVLRQRPACALEKVALQIVADIVRAAESRPS